MCTVLHQRAFATSTAGFSGRRVGPSSPRPFRCASQSLPSTRQRVVRKAVELSQAESLVSAGSVLLDATVAVSSSVVPSWEEATNWLLKHPLYVVCGGALALAVVPRIIEVLLKYLLVPALVLSAATFVLVYPEDAAAALTTLFDWISSYPELFSILTIVAVAVGLLPAILSVAGVSSAVYLLLIFLYSGTPTPVGTQVKEMQSELREVVAKGQGVVKAIGAISRLS